MPILSAGERAPGFVLRRTPNQELALSELRGRPVILALSERALFVIDSEGIITWSYLSPIAINPGAGGILEALDELTSGKGCEASEARRGSSDNQAAQERGNP